MSAMNGLVLPIAADLSAFNASMDAAAKRLEEFSGTTTAKLGGTSGGGSSGASSGASSSAAQNFAPMASIASKLGQQIERLTSAFSSGFGRMGVAGKENRFAIGAVKGASLGGRITSAANLDGGGAKFESKAGLKGYSEYLKNKYGGAAGGGMASVPPSAVTASAKVAQNMGAVNRTTQAATASMRGFGGQVLVALGAFGLGFKFVEGIRASVTAASDLNEQLSKSGVVFGPAAEGVKAAAQDMATKFGVPKAEFIDAASSIGLIAKASGKSKTEAAELGTNFAKMGIDASSFYNVPLEEALTSIRAGLVGEAEPMRRFGVLLSEAAVKSEAVRLGIAKTGAELTEGQKVQARASLITRGLTDAQGDMARTSGGVANMLRSLGGRATNLAADFGTAIQPLTDMALKGAAGFLTWGASIVQWGASSGGVLSGFVTAIQYLPAQWSIAKDQFSLGALQMLEWIKVLPENLAIVGNYLANNWTKLIADGLNLAGTVFTNFMTNIKNGWQAVMTYLQGGEFNFNWQPLAAGFKATADSLPAMVQPAVTEAMKELERGIAAKQDKMTADMIAQQQAKTDAVAPAGKEAEDLAAAAAAKKKKTPKSFAAAVEFGSKEARTSILAGRGLADGRDGLKDLAKQSKTQTGLLNRAATALERIESLNATTAALPI